MPKKGKIFFSFYPRTMCTEVIVMQCQSFSQKLQFPLMTPVPSPKHLPVCFSQLDCASSTISVVLQHSQCCPDQWQPELFCLQITVQLRPFSVCLLFSHFFVNNFLRLHSSVEARYENNEEKKTFRSLTLKNNLESSIIIPQILILV